MRHGAMLLLALVLPSAAYAQLARTPADLRRLVSGGDQIDVVAGAREIVPGRLVDVSEASIVVSTSAGVRAFAWNDVHEVWRVRRPSLWKALAAGAAVGAGLGGLAKLGEGDCDDPESLCATEGPITAADFVGATTAGALVGGATTLFLRRRTLVFFPAGREETLGTPEPSSPPSEAWTRLDAGAWPTRHGPCGGPHPQRIGRAADGRLDSPRRRWT